MPIWTHPITPPFNEEYIFAENEAQLLQNAVAFLRFHGNPDIPKIRRFEQENGKIKCPIRSLLKKSCLNN